MEICPMCGMHRMKSFEEKKGVCWSCNFDFGKPLRELSKKQIHDLMASYEYTVLEDGLYRIEAVKNIRDIALRNSVGTPNFIAEIADGAYSRCKFLQRLELHDGLRSIGDNAFGSCRDLFDMFIPATVTRMGKGVFDCCYDLREIRCGAPEKPEGWDDGWLEGCDATVMWGCTE